MGGHWFTNDHIVSTRKSYNGVGSAIYFVGFLVCCCFCNLFITSLGMIS